MELGNYCRHFISSAGVARELAESGVADCVTSRHPEIVLKARREPRSGVGGVGHVGITVGRVGRHVSTAKRKGQRIKI